MDDNVEEKFKQQLIRYSNANNGRFSTQTVDRIVLNSTDNDMKLFMDFMADDTGEFASHFGKEGTMIELAEKYQVFNARELVELYRKSRRF